METKLAWLDEGLALIGDQGAGALRIDRVAVRLGLSKGSFYHHFAGLSAYRLALLDHYERRYTTRYIEATTSRADSGSRRAQLVNLVFTAPDPGDHLDVAIRAWATQDDDAREAIRRIDRIRLDYLLDLFAGTPDAELRALCMYLLLIGARHLIPPLSEPETRRLYDWALGDTKVTA